SQAFIERNPLAPGRSSAAARAAQARRTIHILDAQTEPEYTFGVIQLENIRTVLAIPMLRAGELLGVILIYRHEVLPFTNNHIALLETFADQAAIAIENARLLTELQTKNADLTEALEQQTATGDILNVTSSSPTDVQPVFDTIAASAKRLCDAREAAVFRFDGELIHLVADGDTGADWADALRNAYPRRPGRGMVTARAIQTGSLVHVPDVQADPEFELTDAAQASGVRTTLSVPMIREGEVIGAITVDRRELKPFLDKEIGLVKTFADQAVIAIENVRLFKELQTSNRELTTALDKQTATSDILRVISQSQTDAQPVFDAIVASAVRLLGAYSGILTRVAGDQIELAALTSTDAAGDSALRALFPRPIQSPEGSHGQAIRARGPLNVADAHTDPRLREEVRAYARVRGFRSQVVVPMLFHEDAIGTISVTRCEPGGFTDDEIALLQTFADQAVIAIENVRLFNETKEALERQTATSEILQVISQSPTDAQPVFDVIARSAVTLCDGYFSLVGVSDGHLLHLRALHNLPEEWSKEARAVYPMPLTSEVGTAPVAPEQRVIHTLDLQEDAGISEAGRVRARVAGYRTWLGVPMLGPAGAIGVLAVARRDRVAFTDKQIALLQTFADQAVIAIENVRLFTELEEKNKALTTAHGQVTEALEQQTATSEILQIISRSQTDVQPVFDTIVQSAARLLRRYSGALTRVAGNHIVLAALTTGDAANDAALRARFPLSLGATTPV